jgi:ribose 5-phosphate isomerase RpiB
MRYETIEVSEAELKEILCKHFEIESHQVQDMRFVSETINVHFGYRRSEVADVSFVELFVENK